jgi:hypothetical protein
MKVRGDGGPFANNSSTRILRCNECGTRYTPPTPAWAAVVFIVIGCILAGGGLFAIGAFVWTKHTQGDLEYVQMMWLALLLVPGGAALLGVALLIHGIRTLTKRPSSKEVVRTIPAPLSSTVRIAMYASGVVCLLGGVLSGLFWLAERLGPLRTGAPSVPYGVLFSLVIGFHVLGWPQRIQRLRDKHLEEYQAAPGAPPPIEAPRPPDVVFLSMWFGILSLFSVAAVFGPAALLCGLVALWRGHLKGLIGMALGAAGLIVWGLVFLYLFQG